MGVHPYCSYTISFRNYGSTSLLQLYYILPQIWEYILIAVILYSPANMGVHPYCSYNIFSRKYGSRSEERRVGKERRTAIGGHAGSKRKQMTSKRRQRSL